MIDILLSTYNGEDFLREQLDSILSQNEHSWRLLIRDDASSDATVEVIKEYCEKHPDTITFITDSETSPLGPAQSFNRLLNKSKAPYVMFSDQDDVWLPEKIEKMLSVMKDMELASNGSVPILLHSDLEVVNENLKNIADSFIKKNNLNPEIIDVKYLSLRNSVTGCSMMCNRSLLDLTLPIPDHAIMHDWWFAITASAFGRIEFISQSLVKYRQHSSNYYGATNRTKILKKSFRFNKYRIKVKLISLQVDAFLNTYGDQLSNEEEKEYLAKFAELHNLSFLKKREVIWKYHRHCQPLIKTLIMLLLA